MNSIALSFATLVKTNNGVFKSAAQAKFLLSQCDNAQFVSCDSFFKNSYTITYVCDENGVIRVEKHALKSGKSSTAWLKIDDAAFQSKQKIVAACEITMRNYTARNKKLFSLLDKIEKSKSCAIDIILSGNVITGCALFTKRTEKFERIEMLRISESLAMEQVFAEHYKNK